MLKVELIPTTVLEYAAALKFMLTWQKATMVRMVHFLLVDHAYAVAERDVCSLSTILEERDTLAAVWSWKWTFFGETGSGTDIDMSAMC
jgi:hypothetical protein